MAATSDIRFKRMQREVENLRDTQDETLDKVDSLEAAILGLNETVVANHEWSKRQFADVNEKLDRLMKHLDVPPKPPAGFVRE
ncbi:MAG: hypothetical protein OXG23_18370 [Chloroflexi bacterium]|nr:hypothetical protein [Chloroflexota bacterium]MDE2636311.1 hypothetical protein [Chloroflexota bacterium]